MNTFIGPSVPARSLLIDKAPYAAWEQVKKQAERSPMVRFRAGCVLWDPSKEEIIGKGCSHPDIKLSKVLASIHAERHAISNSHRRSLDGAWAIVYTINGRGGCAWSSRPCYSCALSLYRANVERVIFAERTKYGEWTIYIETPKALLARAVVTKGLFAREQRISTI